MVPTDDERTWATLAHLSGLAAPLVGPLVILLMYQDRSAFVRYHALQAILMTVVLGVSAVVFIWFATIISVLTCGLGSVLFALLPIAGVVPLYEGWKAWQGEWHTLPGISEFGR